MTQIKKIRAVFNTEEVYTEKQKVHTVTDVKKVQASTKLSTFFWWYFARVGVIIEWPLYWQFNNVHDVILTSWTDLFLRKIEIYIVEMLL